MRNNNLSLFLRADRLPSDLPAWECHVHTCYTDGEMSVREAVDEALTLGLSRIIFTEHTEPWRAQSTNWFSEYTAVIHAERKRVGDQIEIVIGLEAAAIDFENGLEMTPEMERDVEYVLGTVHRYPGIKGRVRDLSHHQAIELEFRTLLALARNPRVNTIAHIGGTCQQYCGLFPIDMVEEIIREATEHHVAIDLNSRYLKPLSKYWSCVKSIGPGSCQVLMLIVLMKLVKLSESSKLNSMDINESITVLITGAGSELAFSIFKACRLSSLPFRIVACDIGANALGLYWADTGYLVPVVKKDPNGYLTALQEIIRREDVKVVFPTPDHELAFLPKHRDSIERESGCRIMINPPAEMKRFNDKWLAYKWYIEHGLPTPKTIRGDDYYDEEKFLSKMSFPVILKPRQGGGSRSLFFIRNFSELKKYLPIVPEPLIQEYLEPSDEEYTAGTYRTMNNEVFVIVLRRELKFGMTYKAEVSLMRIWIDSAIR
jgi:histidinol phosphatase-like PHP family hydrolase